MKKKFKIWDEKCKENHSDDYCYLRLIESHKNPDDVVLSAVDVDGKSIQDGYILVLDPNLRIALVLNGISREIPLKTDLANTLMVYTEDDIQKITRPHVMAVELTDFMQRFTQERSDAMVKSKDPTLN